ncbi:MAG: GAF domain-containing protein [Mycobacteriales bacterium]|nr:MAG: transcriptional regulator [Pseudonocardiales bacterium]
MTDASPAGADTVADPGRRDARIAEAFVTLADTLVADYDVIDLLTTLAERCTQLLDAAAVGIMLSDQRGGLRTVAASSEAARLLELFELQVDEGPCLDCFAAGAGTFCRDLAAEPNRWPAFVAHARAVGFAAVSALPLRLRDQTIGALNLFHTRTGGLDDADERIGQALADVASIGILQERAIRRGEVLTEQLQTALNGRVAIEQAKGILAQHAGPQLDMNGAFAALRRYARARQRRLSEVAAEVVAGSADLDGVLG